MKRVLTAFAVAAAMTVAGAAHASGNLIAVGQGAFTAQAGLITFSEFAGGTTNPVYHPSDYGGGAGAPIVSFGGYFTGQSLGTFTTCPAGAAPSGCVVGSPTGGGLTLDPNSPATYIASDGAQPTTPVLSGSPLYNGPIAILFSTLQAGVGLSGGYFDAVGSTGITAFDIHGNVIGEVSNTQTGVEFLGLVTADNSATIAGLLFHLVGNEPAGFDVDNIRFGVGDQITVPPGVPEPATWAMMLFGFGTIGAVLRRRRGAAAFA